MGMPLLSGMDGSGEDAFEAMRAMWRAKAVSGVAGRGAPAAGLSVDSEGMGGLGGGDHGGGMAEGYGETEEDSASSEEEGPGGGTDAPGRVRVRGTVGQAVEGAEWAGDDVRRVGKGEGMCVTTLNLRRFGSGPTAFEEQHLLFRGIKAMGADFAGFADVGTSAGRQGNGDVEVNTTAGNAIARAGRWWGGKQMAWCHGQGLSGLRGIGGDLPEGGVGCELAMEGEGGEQAARHQGVGKVYWGDSGGGASVEQGGGNHPGVCTEQRRGDMEETAGSDGRNEG